MTVRKPPTTVTDWVSTRVIRRIGGAFLNADAWGLKPHPYNSYDYDNGRLRISQNHWFKFHVSTYTQDGAKVRVRVYCIFSKIGKSQIRMQTNITGPDKIHPGMSHKLTWNHCFSFESGTELPLDKMKDDWTKTIIGLLEGAGYSLRRRKHGTGTGTKDQQEGEPEADDKAGL